MNQYEFDSRIDRPVRMKLPEFQRNDRLKHIIFAEQFRPDFLTHVCRLASMTRDLALNRDGALFLSNLLPHRRAMLYFSQPSTRTFLSFVAAAQILGVRWADLRDRASAEISSFSKGEDQFDGIRMFASYFDVIVIRTAQSDFPERCAYLMNNNEAIEHRNIPIINAGSGADEHPTQALLDLYTLSQCFQFSSPQDSRRWRWFDDLRRAYPHLRKGLGYKRYGFCGDIGRGRTIRSLALLLSLYPGVTMDFVSPPIRKLALSADLRARLEASGVTVNVADRLEDILPHVDALYMTRIQREHDTDRDSRKLDEIDLSAYQLSLAKVAAMKEYAPILHPFPRNSKNRAGEPDQSKSEILFEVDSDHRARYFDQARNGMWIRSALLAYLFDVDTKILSHHQEVFAQYHDYNEGAVLST